MTREEHIEYCRICLNRKMDSRHGLICQLTGKIADFEDECKDFDRDKAQEEMLFLRRLDHAGDGVDGDPVNFKKNKSNGQLIGLLGAGILLFTLMSPSPIIVIPFGLIVYGIHLYRKGAEQEKIIQEKENKNQ